MKLSRWLPWAVLAALLTLAWLAKTVTIPLIAAWILMTILLPLRTKLSSRIGKTGATLTCISLVFLTPLLLIGPVIFDLNDFKALLPGPASVDHYQHQFEGALRTLELSLPQPLASQVSQLNSSQLVEPLAGRLASFAADVLHFLGGVFGFLTALILFPVFLFFLLQGAPWLPQIRAEVPPAWQGPFDRIFPRVRELLAEYCRARFLVALAKGAVAGIILFLAGVPAAYTVGLVIGVASLLPVVGPMIGFCFLLLVAFPHQGPSGLWLAIFIYASTEILEGYVLLPRLVGRRLGIDDFAVILAVLIGGAAFGIFGMLLAIPALVIGRVFYQELLKPVLSQT